MGIGQALSEFWAARSPRERSVLRAGAVLVLGALLYGAILEPGLEARQRLSAALPRLRAQAHDMRLQKKEIEQLRRTAGAVPQSGDLRALLRASVERSSWQRSVERIEWRSDERVLVAASAVGFDQWLDWLRALQHELGVRVVSCEITALPQPGVVRVEAVFAAAKAP
jgi:general secretion pathway protein M